MPGHGVPTWRQVQRRRWEPFTRPRFVVDNVGDPVGHVADVVGWLASEEN